MEVKTLDRTQPTAKSKRLSFLNRNKRNVLIHILPASKSGTKSTPTRWMHMPLQHEKTVFIGGPDVIIQFNAYIQIYMQIFRGDMG